LAGQRYAAEQKAWQWEELARRATDITEKLNAEIPPPKRRQGRPKSQAWYETELKFWSDISDGQWKNPEALERESVDYLQQEFRPDIGPRSDRLVRQVRDDVLRVWRANPEISPTRHTLICLIALDNSSPGLRDFLGKRLRRRGFQC
jgi:hypothetical protein